jgi:outer membrane receptor protein involved in Fe transport
MPSKYFRCLAPAALILASGIVQGQTSKGILAGVIHDSTGAVVSGATVTATNLDTHEVRTSVSRGDGAYSLEALTPGRYTISMKQNGFKTFETNGLVVNPSVVTSYGATLTLGGVTDTVLVEAENSGINTENGQLAGVISTRQLQDLPIFTLNPVELALTVPGVQPVSQNSGFSNGLNIEVNGARPRANNFLLDGQEVNDVGIGGQAFQPNIPDIFQSVTVITNTPSAEYGRAGGAVVNLVTKAGTNAYHGSVFERYTGSGLDSLDGVTRQGIVHGPPPVGYVPPQKARFDQHQYGFTAGGPIIKNKLFGFGALQISRFYGKEVPSRLELPDAAGYAQLQAIGGPQVALLDQYLSHGSYLTDYVAFPGNGVVTNINVGVQHNCPSGCTVTTGFFQRQNASEQNPDTQWMYRVDFVPREADSFSFRYLHDRASLSPDFFTNGSALVGFDTQQGGPTELGAGTWTHVFGPNVVNELRASETRLGFLFSPLASSISNPLYALSTLNITNVAVDSSGASSLGPNQNFPQGRHEDLYQVQDNVSLTRGHQTLRIGFDIGRTIETDIVSLNAKGTLTFNKGGTGVSSLGNFLQNQLGPSGSATKTFGSTRVDPHGWRSGIFAQDDVKVNSDLTVNLGIRYDYLTNPENSLPYPAIDPFNPYQAINTVIKVKNDTNNVAPRVGFAYSPHGDGLLGGGKTVVRGGFGVSFDSPFSNFVVNAAQATPNAVSGTLVSTKGNGLANATSLVSSITPTLLPTSSVTSVVKDMVNPYTYQFNLGIEHQLPGSNLIAVRYIGSLGKKLYANKQYNYFAPDGSGNRLNPTRGVINARGNFASSSYNGAQVEFTHNFQHGLLISANYVFSKNLDNGSEIFATGANPNTSYQADLGPNGFAQEWGPSAYDHRHFVSVAYVWAPAGFSSSNSFTNAALGVLTRHWTISGIEQFQTGSYSTVSIAGFDTNGDGNAFNDRPLIGNVHAPIDTAAIDGGNLDPTLAGTYYDAAAALNGDGSLKPVNSSSVRWLIPYQPLNQDLHREIGRNSFENPGSTTNNIAVEKGFGTKYLHLDRGAFILRAEVQNIGNHNDVGILDTSVTDIGSPNFLNRSNARIAAPPNAPFSYGRNIVLWGKFTF